MSKKTGFKGCPGFCENYNLNFEEKKKIHVKRNEWIRKVALSTFRIDWLYSVSWIAGAVRCSSLGNFPSIKILSEYFAFSLHWHFFIFTFWTNLCQVNSHHQMQQELKKKRFSKIFSKNGSSLHQYKMIMFFTNLLGFSTVSSLVSSTVQNDINLRKEGVWISVSYVLL